MFCKYCGRRLDNSSTPIEQFDIENDAQNKKGIIEIFKENYAKAEKEVDEKNKKEMIENIQNTLGKYLKPKDGKKHMIAFATKVILAKDFNDMYNAQIEKVLEIMQSKEYEVLEIKTEGIQVANRRYL